MKINVSMIRAVVLTMAVVSLGPSALGRTGAWTGPLTVIGPTSGGQRPLLLGYDEGEERRYTLGPPEALGRGESATWSIYLRELSGQPSEGIFELKHEWHRAETRTELPLGAITWIVSEGELRVNGHGFPLAVDFRTERHLAGMGSEIYTIRYRYEDEVYRKQVSAEGADLVHTAMIRSHKYLDRSVPSGLFVLVPTALDCSVPRAGGRQTARVAPPSVTAGPPPPSLSQPLMVADNRACREALFANPGLISLMLPALWEETTGEREFLLLTPTGPFGMPGLSGGVQTRGGAMASRGGFDMTRAASPETNTGTERLRYRERVEVEVGSRKRQAWLFGRMGDFESIYVDDDGVVLKIDYSERSLLGLVAGGGLPGVDPTPTPRGRRSIRLLFPSEY